MLVRGSSCASTTGPRPSCAGGSETEGSRDESAPRADWIASAPGRGTGKGDGGCRQASEKAALAAKAHLDKTALSATSSTS